MIAPMETRLRPDRTRTKSGPCKKKPGMVAGGAIWVRIRHTIQLPTVQIYLRGYEPVAMVADATPAPPARPTAKKLYPHLVSETYNRVFLRGTYEAYERLWYTFSVANP
jgi:hypothetical protein